MHTISSNHYSVDQQASDALDFLRGSHPDAYTAIRRDFPENIVWEGSWFDTDAMAVDQEWGSWLIDAIEATGLVWWEEGEPWAGERDEDEDDTCRFHSLQDCSDPICIRERGGSVLASELRDAERQLS